MLAGGKRLLITVILLCILVQATNSSNAVLPTGNLFYSNFLSVGKGIEWQVSVLDWSGNESIYFDAHIGNIAISQGDMMKLRVTHDPNTLPIDLEAEGEWLNLSLNEQEMRYDPADVQLGYHAWIYGDFFTAPALRIFDDYSTKLFEEYYAHVIPTEYNNTEYYTDAGEGYSVVLINTESLLYNITDTLYKETFYYCEYFNASDTQHENEEESLFKLYSFLYESIIDIERGTVFSYKYYIDSVYNFTSASEENEYTEDHYHLLVENTDETVGYTDDLIPTDPALSFETIFGINVNYVVFGVAIFTALFAGVGWVYRRKKDQQIDQVEKQQINQFAEEIKKVIQSPQSQGKKDEQQR